VERKTALDIDRAPADSAERIERVVKEE